METSGLDTARLVRFRTAIDSVVSFDKRDRVGIGMQKEKTMHAVIKNYVDPDPLHQEVPVGRYIADICDAQQHRITEVQTANFGLLREKLTAFLPEYQVTVIYPIAHRKTVTWIDPETGELAASNVSHTTGSFYDVFRELYRISGYLCEPNLTIEPLLIDMTEYRLQDGWSRDGKRGSHRFDRMPEGLYDDLVLHDAADYAAFLPPDLPEEFTAKEFGEAVGIHRRSLSYSTVLRMLSDLGVVERIGQTQRRAYIYRELLHNETGRDFSRRKHR